MSSVELVRAARLTAFCERLIAASEVVGGLGGIRWEPFMRRSDVEDELQSQGYELVTEGEAFNLRRRVYFAMRVAP